MTALPKPSMDRGFKLEVRPLPVAQRVELFGHVTLVEGYAVPGFVGCHALVALRDTPGSTAAVLTTGNLIAFRDQQLANPPTLLGGTWAVDIYAIDDVILYSMA